MPATEARGIESRAIVEQAEDDLFTPNLAKCVKNLTNCGGKQAVFRVRTFVDNSCAATETRGMPPPAEEYCHADTHPRSSKRVLLVHIQPTQLGDRGLFA